MMNKEQKLRCFYHIALGIAALYAVNLMIDERVLNAIDNPVMQWVHALMTVTLLLCTFYHLLIWSIKLFLALCPYGKRFLINMVSDE